MNTNIPIIQKKRANAYGSINYMLYDGGKKYDIYDGYETNIKSGEKSLDALKNNLSLTVIQYYFDYLSLEAKKRCKTKRDRTINSTRR